MLILALCLSLSAELSAAGDSAEIQGDAALQFDIPSQSLGMALQRYANETGASVFFDNTLTAGKSSTPVHGTYTTEDALLRLLDGSGLEVRHTSSNSFTVVGSVQSTPPSLAAAAVSSNGENPGKPFHSLDAQRAGKLQRALEQTLCKSPQTRPGRYRALIRFWLGADGRVRRGGVLGTTGLPQRDGAIDRALSTLVVTGLPPSSAGAEPPFTVLLLPQSDNTSDVCTRVEEEEF